MSAEIYCTGWRGSGSPLAAIRQLNYIRASRLHSWFYQKLGWRLDADFRFDNDFRVVQFRRPARGVPSSSARK